VLTGLCVLAPFASSAAEPAARDEDFKSIFDGKSLEGWDGDPVYWRVEEGSLVGEVTPQTLLKRNSFIVWRGGTVADFELKLDYRVSPRGNSGVNYRSLDLEALPRLMRGYQADIDGEDRWTGNLYEERGRTFIAKRGQRSVVEPGKRARVVEVFDDPAVLQKTVVKKEDWNTYHIIVRGDHHRIFLNGVLMTEAWDHDRVNGTRSGLLGVQVHIGPPMKIEYRNIRLAQLKSTGSDGAERARHSLTEAEHKALMGFDNVMEGLKYVEDQAARLTAAPSTEPIDGKTELTLTSKLYLVRSDLGNPKGNEKAKDVVLIDGATTVRIPGAGLMHADAGFETTFTWTLKWNGTKRAYEIVERK
jgi:hypothetical protein